MADAPGRPLRLLSLDGGGVRGLTSLYILRQLMHQLGTESEPAKPCQHFDIIAGTSTGGLIAIMLGILEMDVETCITAYQNLAKRVFKPKRGRSIFGSVGKLVGGLVGSCAFDEHELENAIKEVLKEQGLPENAKFASGPSGCRVFVMATLDDMSNMKLRSYWHPKDASVMGKFTIVGAARATSAAPGFFPALEHGGLKFVDGALGVNNPVHELYNEAHTLFKGSITIGCLVSIGTGVSKETKLGSSLLQVAKGCAAIATQTDKTAQLFEDSHATERRELCDRYFRFNVERGCMGVQLDEWSKASKLTTAAHAYLKENRTKKEVDKCVQRMKEAVTPVTLQPPPDPYPRNASPASFTSQAPPSPHGGPERPTWNAEYSNNSAFSPPPINSSSNSPNSSPAPQKNPYEPPHQQVPYQQSSQFLSQDNQEQNFQTQQQRSQQYQHQPQFLHQNQGQYQQQAQYQPQGELVRRGNSPNPNLNNMDYHGYNPNQFYNAQNQYQNNQNQYQPNQNQNHSSQSRAQDWDEVPNSRFWSNLDYYAIRVASYFVQRSPIMNEILELLRTERVATLVGIGGSGKTQLALKIAKDINMGYKAVFWFESRAHADLTNSFLRIAQMLNLAPPRHTHLRENQVSRRHEQDYIISVKKFLSDRNTPWLMVFDNCDDPKVLEDLPNYFPQGGNGHIIVTSRRDEAFRLVRDGVMIEGLEEDDAVWLLLKHAKITNPSAKERESAVEIVKKLDGLALAIDLAGGYVRQQRSSLGDYVSQYERRKEDVLKKVFQQQKSGTYPNTVFTAWDLSIQVMSEEARNLIYLLSFLDRTNIRLDLFNRCVAVRRRWRPDGTIRYIQPDSKESGVPVWLTKHLLQESRFPGHHHLKDDSVPNIREFDDIKFNELINEICSFSFAKVEKPDGDALYEYTDTTIFKTKSTAQASYDKRILDIHPLLHEIARLYLEEELQKEYEGYAQRILWHSVDDDADECLRLTSNPQYSPMITLAGGASIDPVLLALRLDETYRHMYPALRNLLTDKMTEVPEIGSFASLLVCFDLLYLVRSAQNSGKDASSTFLSEQSCGWDKLNNEIKRARLLVRPNILHQWMTIATRAPEIWRKEFEPASSYEMIAKAEKKLYEGFRKKREGTTKWNNYVDEKKLLQNQKPIPDSNGLYVPMWSNVIAGAMAIKEWNPKAWDVNDQDKDRDKVYLIHFDAQWPDGGKAEPKTIPDLEAHFKQAKESGEWASNNDGGRIEELDE